MNEYVCKKDSSHNSFAKNKKGCFVCRTCQNQNAKNRLARETAQEREARLKWLKKHRKSRVNPSKTKASPREVCLKSYDIKDGHWIWNGKVYLEKSNGRRKFGYNSGKNHVRAYNAFFEEYFGEVPEGMSVSQNCGEFFCVNPEHLEVRTLLEINRDVARRILIPHGEILLKRRECSKGHDYSVHGRINRNGQRSCLECKKIDGKKRYINTPDEVKERRRAYQNEYIKKNRAELNRRKKEKRRINRELGLQYV